jgi:tRNA-splicing ligase RtcB (3'-phosphate/5'-hydroxy nucleic acid ligase)
VVPTYRAIIPAAVGVDIGCGMLAVKTTLVEEDLPTNLTALRIAIEEAVPHGRTHNGDPHNDAGSWCNDIPSNVAKVWKASLEQEFQRLCVKRPALVTSNHINHLGTLGTGNHFIEICVEEHSGGAAAVKERQGGRSIWLMLHSGSRGVGGRIGSMFITVAKQDMGALVSNLPDTDLSYLTEGTAHFEEYMRAVHWAQNFARLNRELMMENLIQSIRASRLLKTPLLTTSMAVNCHHNYVEKYTLPSFHEGSVGESVWLTRKGATSARKGELAVIPGSMGTRSYIVQGKGNEASYQSCSHGAGRRFSRGESKRRFTVADHELSTAGVECRKDESVLDETPAAYKPIDAVIDAQSDLVSVVCTLKQILCVKG